MKTRIATILLPAALALCSIAAAPADSDSQLPSQVTTRDGRTYTAVEQVRVEPDGVLVNYSPGPGGVGMAKLKFRDLSDDLQKKFKYDQKQAADFEARENETTGRFMQARANEELWLIRYRDLAELHQSLAGDNTAAYAVSMDTNGLVAARGFTETVGIQNVTNVIGGDVPYPNYSGYPITFPTIYNGVPVTETAAPVQQP